jgi:thymidylate kinase
MKLILIDGGPASGKNTLGIILVDDFNSRGDKSTLLDLDDYVEEFCPKWIWGDNKQKEKDLQNARANFIKDINKYLQENYIVIAIGERFLTKDNVMGYTSKLAPKCPIYLYHLSVPIELRKQRLDLRGPHSLIDLEKDQKDRDNITSWPGYIYQNVGSPIFDAKELIKLIQCNKGIIDVKTS